MNLFKLGIILAFLSTNTYALEGLRFYGLSSTFEDSNPKDYANFLLRPVPLLPSYRFGSSIFSDDIITGNTSFGYRPSQNHFPCKDQNGNVQYGFSLMLNTSKVMNRKAACTEALSWGGYDNCSCSFYESCTLSVFGATSIRELITDSRFRLEVAPELKKVTANSYVERALKKDLQEIADAAELRVYAKMSSIQIDPLNKCEYKNNMRAECNEDEFEKDLQTLMKGCNSNSGYPCFEMDSDSYKKQKESSEDKKLTIEKYIYEKAAASIVVDNGKDTEIATGLFTILSESEKSKNKKVDNGKIFEYLKINQDKLDPVLKRVFQKKISIEQFLTSIKGPYADADKLRESIHTFRNDYLIKEFTGEGCNNKKTLRKICENKEALNSTKRRDFQRMDKGELADLFSFEKLDADYDRYKMSKMLPVIQNKDEYTHMVKAYRCFMMSYQLKADGRVDGENFCMDPTGEGRSAFESVTDNSSSESVEEENRSQAKSLASIDEGVDFSSIESSRTSGSISIRGNEISDTSIDTPSGSGIGENSSEELHKAMNDSLTNSFGTNNTFDSNSEFRPNNSFFNSGVADNKIIAKDKESGEQVLDKTVVDNTTISIEEKIKELNKKLAEAESNFEKVKKASEKKSEADSVPSTNIDQMKALEAQIAQLKNELTASKQKLSASDDRSPVARHENNASATNSTSFSRDADSKLSNQTQTQPQGQSAGTSSSSSPLDQGLNRASATSAVSQLGGAVVAGSKTSGVGLVLTKVDGLSQDAFVDTINSKIKEFNGEPFLIEEGGYVKEIIPVLKDGRVVMDDKGQPIFEKIVKGKVADVKAKKSGRAPASVTNAADLKKLEAQKVKKEVDRIKYKSLKDLTDQAVK